jgi:protein-arginine kinase activator protein McsA
MLIKCEICDRLFKGQRGISHHVLQHSKKCLEGYNQKFGNDRRLWPSKTHLNLRVCEECGVALKDPRSMKFCSSCGQTKHNVMKRPENREKAKLYMSNGGVVTARKGLIKFPHKQKKLFDIIKKIIPGALFEYHVISNTGKNYFIDIAILDLKIAIEHDETKTHFNKKKDLFRQTEIESLGWLFIRFINDIPTDVEVDLALKKATTVQLNKTFRIEDVINHGIKKE